MHQKGANMASLQDMLRNAADRLEQRANRNTRALARYTEASRTVGSGNVSADQAKELGEALVDGAKAWQTLKARQREILEHLAEWAKDVEDTVIKDEDKEGFQESVTRVISVIDGSLPPFDKIG